jgi:hypothetical protein
MVQVRTIDHKLIEFTDIVTLSTTRSLCSTRFSRFFILKTVYKRGNNVSSMTNGDDFETQKPYLNPLNDPF